MRIFYIFLLITGATSKNSKLIKAKAFHDLTEVLFIKPKIPFDVIAYKTKSPKISELINGIGSQLSGKIFSTSSTFHLTQSAVIFTRTEKDLREFFNQTELRNVVAKPLRFLIHTSEKFELEKLKIPRPTFDQGHIGHFSYFVSETAKEIQLKTFEWFTDKICHVQQEILLNSFEKSKQKWKKKLKIEEKFRNFHNCTLEIFSRIFNFESLFVLADKNKLNQVQSFEVEIVSGIAKRANFTAKFSTDDLQKNLNVYFLPRAHILKDDCHIGPIFWEDFVFFAISPPESYDSYEKLHLTFDKYTWFCLLAVFIGGFLAIFIVSKMPLEVQNLVFGEKVQSPMMNLMAQFFGVGQKTMPRNNFARIILLFYMMFCLVMNTAYHGEEKSYELRCKKFAPKFTLKLCSQNLLRSFALKFCSKSLL